MLLMKKHHQGMKRPDPTQGFYCRGRIWIEKEGETYLGYGRIILLTKIGELGSISQAAKSMQMSYKQAWDLVDSMNRQASVPLVTASKGGRGGGGTQLTTAGVAAIHEFNRLLLRLETFLTEETSGLQL
jgi:molybdate transport system regulatory protein